MVRRIEATAELDRQLGDGSTLRETLQFQQKMYGFRDPRLNEEALPYIAVPLWNTFWTLHETRQVSAIGTFQPITYVEISAYSQLMQADFEPWEIEVVKKMDRAFLTKINTRQGDK